MSMRNIDRNGRLVRMMNSQSGDLNFMTDGGVHHRGFPGPSLLSALLVMPAGGGRGGGSGGYSLIEISKFSVRENWGTGGLLTVPRLWESWYVARPEAEADPGVDGGPPLRSCSEISAKIWTWLSFVGGVEVPVTPGGVAAASPSTFVAGAGAGAGARAGGRGRTESEYGVGSGPGVPSTNW